MVVSPVSCSICREPNSIRFSSERTVALEKERRGAKAREPVYSRQALKRDTTGDGDADEDIAMGEGEGTNREGTPALCKKTRKRGKEAARATEEGKMLQLGEV